MSKMILKNFKNIFIERFHVFFNETECWIELAWDLFVALVLTLCHARCVLSVSLGLSSA